MSDNLLSTITVPEVIAKDECIYCFETPFNDNSADVIDPTVEHSLNTCLTCFQSVCSRHVELHMKVTSHSCDSIHLLYLEVAKVKKNDEDVEQKMSDIESNKKLKLEVIEKSEDELYDTLWSLKEYKFDAESTYVVLSNNNDSSIKQETLTIVNKIINAKSQNLVDQTNSWQLEIKPCTHSSILSSKIEEMTKSNLNLNKCSSCELTSNLWLCLHCGNIGCGREQIGIEGHSHALDHFEKNQEHPLAIKLGSLSNSSNDIYCYACNDEVSFEKSDHLANILSNYGIDVANRQAREKTLVELQVEQNMNWDFKMVDSKGKDLIKLSADKDLGCGLVNLGNSCYLNSILEVLFNGGIPGWTLDNIGFTFPLDVVFPSNNLRCQLIKLNNAIKLEPERYPNGIKPTSFKKCVSSGNEEFSSGRQQDVMEFFGFLTNLLDKKQFQNTANDNNPNSLFKYLMEERIQCNNCHAVKYIVEAQEFVQLPLKQNEDPQSLRENIEGFFDGEVVNFSCPNCKVSSTATKKPTFKTYPSTLIINPIRIKLENWTPVKTSNELSMPGLGNEEFLDLGEFKSQNYDPSTEILIKEDETSNEFIPNPTFVSQLSEMGFAVNAITRALYNTNNQDTETAMNWLFQHMEESDLNEPFSPPKTPKSNECDPEALSNMTSMGLDPKLCKKALIVNNHDVNKSVEWVFNNMDDDGELPSQEENSSLQTFGSAESTPYHLTAVVCHKGNSVHSGHYVVFIKKRIHNEIKWVLFNDEKIVIAEDVEELKQNGYIYFYTKST